MTTLWIVNWAIMTALFAVTYSVMERRPAEWDPLTCQRLLGILLGAIMVIAATGAVASLGESIRDTLMILKERL